jgi:hypothetical protein
MFRGSLRFSRWREARRRRGQDRGFVTVLSKVGSHETTEAESCRYGRRIRLLGAGGVVATLLGNALPVLRDGLQVA